MIIITVIITIIMKEGRKEMFYFTTHSTHFIYGFMALDIWLRTTQITRLLFPISSKDSFICTIPQNSTHHSICYTSRGALAGTRNISMGSSWRINPMTHRTMNGCFYQRATSRSFFCPRQETEEGGGGNVGFLLWQLRWRSKATWSENCGKERRLRCSCDLWRSWWQN